MADLEPGEYATLGVTFIEDREGRAIVRLPNGSKTTVEYGSVRPVGGAAHFVRDGDGPGESVWCHEQDCDWTAHRESRIAAEDAYVSHIGDTHPETLRA